MRLIDVDELWDSIRNDVAPFNISMISRHIHNATTINPDDLVKHGEWGTCSDRPDRLICSECNCGFDMWKHDRHNYCPNCGAKMDGRICGYERKQNDI